MGAGLRPSWKFLCPKVQAQPLTIIGRSRVGKQMLCKGHQGLHLLMFCGGTWGFVGGVISFKGEPVRADEVSSAMFVEEQDNEEPQIILQFELLDGHNNARGVPRVGVLHTTAHACSDSAAFRWVLDTDQRRALGRRLGEHTATRAGHIGSTLGGRLPDFLQLDSHARELSPSLDFVPVFHIVAPLRELKLHGRPRFSKDRTSRGFRSSSLKEDDETLCIAALIAVLSTVHKSSDQWRIDATVQLLFGHTHACAVLSNTRTTQRRRVGQLRRWLPFVKALAVATDDFCHDVDDQLEQCGQRTGWGVKRAPKVTALVLLWISGKSWLAVSLVGRVLLSQIITLNIFFAEGLRADAIFVAKRPEWDTAGLTAAEWVECCFIHIKRDASLPEPSSTIVMDEEQGTDWTGVINPFIAAFCEIRGDIMAAVHGSIEVTGPASEQYRDEHVAKVHGLLDNVMQNVGTHMRNCKGVVDLSRKLHTHMHRMQKGTEDNQRLLGDLRVAAGAYTEDVTAVGRKVQAATKSLEDLMHLTINAHPQKQLA